MGVYQLYLSNTRLKFLHVVDLCCSTQVSRMCSCISCCLKLPRLSRTSSHFWVSTCGEGLRTCRRTSQNGYILFASSVMKSSDTGCFAFSFVNSFVMKPGGSRAYGPKKRSSEIRFPWLPSVFMRVMCGFLFALVEFCYWGNWCFVLLLAEDCHLPHLL